MKNILTPIIARLSSLISSAAAPVVAAADSSPVNAANVQTHQTRLTPSASNDPAEAGVTPSAEAPARQRVARKSRDTTEYQVGQQIEGVISGIERYGVFVRLPNGESGLVFQSEVCWPGEDVPCAVGDFVKVEVLSFKAGRGLALSMRQTRVQAAFEDFVASYPVGATVKGNVKSVLDYGVFVTLAPGVCGLLHVSAVKDLHKFGKESIGQEIKVKVGSVNHELRRISLEVCQ